MSSSAYNTENDLAVLIASGNQTAFTKLVDEKWRQVYGHALAYVKSSEKAQEITQDIFLKLWQNREKLTEVKNLENYLFILGRNHIVSEMRRRLTDTYPGVPDTLEEDVWVPDRQLQLKQSTQLLLKGIAALPPMRRQVFILSRMDGLTHEEISERLGIAKNTVKQHIVLSLNFLRDYVRNHPGAFLVLTIFFSEK